MVEVEERLVVAGHKAESRGKPGGRQALRAQVQVRKPDATPKQG